MKMSYFSPYSYSKKKKIEVELDLSDYWAKSDSKSQITIW